MSNIYYRMIMGFLCLVFVGCAATPPARFYLLTPMPGVMAPQCNDPTSQATVVGVEPVVLADYLNRPQIMTRVDPNQIMPLEFHRWAGSLERDFSRVLIDNLGLLLATDQIVVYPSNAMVRHYWRVAVQVLRFDGIIDQQATLEARWTIIGFANGDRVVIITEHQTSSPVRRAERRCNAPIPRVSAPDAPRRGPNRLKRGRPGISGHRVHHEPSIRQRESGPCGLLLECTGPTHHRSALCKSRGRHRLGRGGG